MKERQEIGKREIGMEKLRKSEIWERKTRKRRMETEESFTVF